jgi:hypothetical protein
MNKDLRTNARAGFEFLRIEISGNRAVYVAQPGGGVPTRFDLIESGAQSVRFANPAHDFLERIAYRRDGDVLTAMIDDGSDSGQRMSWRWHRCGGKIQPMRRGSSGPLSAAERAHGTTCRNDLSRT